MEYSWKWAYCTFPHSLRLRVVYIMLGDYDLVRLCVAGVLSTALALHGYRKRSLDISGACAAVCVGFVSFVVSYRMGTILIVFYYTSSKITKVREDVKEQFERDYKVAGQRNATQVLANSAMATVVAALYFLVIGEDRHTVEFTLGHGIRILMDQAGATDAVGRVFRKQLASYLWAMYVAHYACANGDTWASELGILSKSRPRLITSFLLRTEVPKGTNGGISLEGTLASALGGALVGLVFWIMSFFMSLERPMGNSAPQYPMIFVGLIAGVLGSVVDSLLGASLQATYYDFDRKQIVKRGNFDAGDANVKIIQGIDILSNEAVNFYSIMITMVLACYLSPFIYALAY